MSHLLPTLLFAALLAACSGQDSGPAAIVQAETPPAPHRLAYTHTGETEVVFLDLNSIVRNGDVVEGWGLNVLAAPLAAFGSSPADLYWMKIRIDCAARVGRFTQAIAMVNGAAISSNQIEMADTPADGNWVMDEAYGCNGAQPTQPVFEQVEEAVRAARSNMVEAAATPAS